MTKDVVENHTTGYARKYSVAMTQDMERQLREHLLRPDGQEDLCLAIYQPSNGAVRLTALITDIVRPLAGEREVHGNVSFTGDYVVRVAAKAIGCGGGVIVLHSHPHASGWQVMSEPDRDAESSFANLVREMTGHPLLGMTLAGGDGTWSARFWSKGVGLDVSPEWCENVRVLGERFAVSWNPALSTSPDFRQAPRTVSSWGANIQADIARLKILVVGVGSVGLDVALRLVATGVQNVAVLDYDSVKYVNLDRNIGITPLDVWLCRSKAEAAARLLRQNATAETFCPEVIEGSVCEFEQFQRALDFDLIFCCVDNHPWPRSILNTIAYTDLIPVIDGGVHIDAFADGEGMRNATWRSHVLRPGRPCMACNGQLDLGMVYLDKDGLLEDEGYIAGLPDSEKPKNQNVSALAISAAASLLAQFVSFVVAPAGQGDPGPLRYSLSTHWLEHDTSITRKNCPIEQRTLAGDRRQVLLDEDTVARKEITDRKQKASRLPVKLGRIVDEVLANLRFRINAAIHARQK